MILASEALWLPYGASLPSTSNRSWISKSNEFPLENQWFLCLRPFDCHTGLPCRLRQIVCEFQKVMYFQWKINDSCVWCFLTAICDFLVVYVNSFVNLKSNEFPMENQWFLRLMLFDCHMGLHCRLRQLFREFEKVMNFRWKINDSCFRGLLAVIWGFLAVYVKSFVNFKK